MSLFKKRNFKLGDPNIKFGVIKYIEDHPDSKWDNKAIATKTFNDLKKSLNQDGSFKFKVETVNKVYVMYAYAQDEKTKENNVILIYFAANGRYLEITANQLFKKYIKKTLNEAVEYDEDNIDECVKVYINKNKSKFKTGAEAEKEFSEVEDTLNIDGAFIFERKMVDGIPTLYMKSAKSGTLLQVYFAIKAEAGHIELSVKELMDNCGKEAKTMNESAILLEKAKVLIEAACEGCEDLEEAKDKLEDVIETLEDVIKDNGDKKEDDDDKVDDKTKEVVNEAITALYTKAALCETAEEAEPYIAKAEELQNAIDSIPEEKPVVDDEYPADDVTGGYGDGTDEDAIKAIVGDDAEAMKLLTSDVDSVIIDN